MFSNNQNNSIWYSWTLKSKFLKVVFLTAMWNHGLWSKNTLAWMEMLTVKDTTQIEYKYFQPSHFVFFWRCYIKRTQLFENMLQLAFYKVLCWTKLILTNCRALASHWLFAHDSVIYNNFATFKTETAVFNLGLWCPSLPELCKFVDDFAHIAALGR